jgi:hypothetical protein
LRAAPFREDPPERVVHGIPMNRIFTLGAALLLAACTALGPPSILLSRGDISERAFIDRTSIDPKKIFKGVQGLDISGPDIGFQTTAQRIELAWTAKLADGPMGIPLSLRISMSGAPVLNAPRNGIDLADARIEEVRLPSVPFINLETRQMNQGGDSLGTIPLLQFRPEELNRDGIVYQATGVSLGTFGLRVDLAPK